MYLNQCFHEVSGHSKTKPDKNDLIQGYISLSKVKSQFKDFINSKKIEEDGKFYLEQNLFKQISKSLMNEANEALIKVKTKDKILKENIISFLQNHRYSGKDSELKKIYNVLLDLCYKVSIRKTIDGILYKEINEIQTPVTNIQFL